MVVTKKTLEPASTTPLGFTRNNFDLVRLLAAAQVACLHAGTHLGAAWLGSVNRCLEFFPGVPVFFFVSGFLISRSFEKRESLGGYFLNRSLRIFPALWVCTMVALSLAVLSGYSLFTGASLADFGAWLVAQLTFFQFYNPDFLRGYGVGVLNGSLWTISVELQFYLLVPVLYWFLERFGSHRRDNVLLGLWLLFLVLNGGFFHFEPILGERVVKVIGVTFIPWFYMFLSGVWLQRNFSVIGKILRYRHVLWLACAGGVVLVQLSGWSKVGNGINAFGFVPLVVLVTLAAYSAPRLSERMLKRNDVSYGIYIYHMPLVNFVRHIGLAGNLGGLLALAGTALASVLSWHLIERRALAYKVHSLRAVDEKPPKKSRAEAPQTD